jgi:hypothetical protein
MEKAAGAGAKAGIRRELAPGCLAVLAACLTCPLLHAQEAGTASTELRVAQARPEVRVQVQTSALPRFDAQDAGFQAPRVDLTLRSNDNSTGLAPVFGMSSLGGSAQALGLQPRTGIDLGVRWTQRLQSQSQIDVTAWRRMNAPDDAYSMVQMQPNPVYGARIEMNFKPVHAPGFMIDHGAVGFQMESGARISVKRKDGRPMIYYRSSF